MDKLFQLLTTAEARQVLVGTELDLDNWNDNQFHTAVVIALHCMLNGPVGVNKQTTFPLVGSGSIKTLVDQTATNRTWQNTVKKLAEYIKANRDWDAVIAESQQMALHGNIWPLWNRTAPS